MEKLKILVVDDEQIVREHFAQNIPWEAAGFSWIGAAINGREAIYMMERELPHLVLTDITMPVMDGLNFAQYVRGRWPQVRIIFLTAHDEIAYAQKAIVLGAKNYLLKMGLSKDQVLQACRTISGEIEQDWMEKEKLNRHLEKSQQEEWAYRKQLIQRLIDRELPALSDNLRQISQILNMQGSNYSIVSLGWDWYSAFHEHSLEVESLDQRQWIAGKAIEQMNELDEKNIRVTVFPYTKCRLIVVVSCLAQRGYTYFQSALHEFVRSCLDKARTALSSDCFVFVSAITSQMDQLSNRIKEGQYNLHGYFYSRKAVLPNQVRLNEQEMDGVHRLELIAMMTKSLHNKEWREFMAKVEQLTTLHNPTYSPLFLLAVAEAILDNGMKIPEQHKEGLKLRLELVNTWQAYCHWWELAVEYFGIPSKLFEQASGVRKEISTICQLITDRYKEDLSISYLADAVHLNPAYVGQLFKQETGEYLSDYIGRIRLHKAKELLGKTEMKIYEVAKAVGITDYRYFCKMFKQVVGVTPTEYKKSL